MSYNFHIKWTLKLPLPANGHKSIRITRQEATGCGELHIPISIRWDTANTTIWWWPTIASTTTISRRYATSFWWWPPSSWAITTRAITPAKWWTHEINSHKIKEMPNNLWDLRKMVVRTNPLVLSIVKIKKIKIVGHFSHQLTKSSYWLFTTHILPTTPHAMGSYKNANN